MSLPTILDFLHFAMLYSSLGYIIYLQARSGYHDPVNKLQNDRLKGPSLNSRGADQGFGLQVYY